MADTFLFPTGPRGRPAQVYRNNVMLDATIRDFSGGWNVVDNDLNLDTKFSKILENMQRGVDGANEVRPGTELFAETSDVLDEIINCEYFSGYIVAVGKNGKMVSIDSAGIVNEIWSNTWANNLSGSPDGWDATSFASFAVFNGELYVVNGVNKPVLITSSMSATYVIDLADQSNANTPIARYIVAHGRYLVMAGSLTDGEEDRLFVSATDVGGTWLGDSAPNDAVNIDLGSRVPSGSQTIKGLGRFRNKLMVMFEDAVLPGTLGVFDTDSNHEPTFDDAIENVGALSHRIIQTIGEDMIFGDVNGVSSVKRALFTGSVTSDRQSYLVDPEYHSSIEAIESTITIEDNVWSMWDSASNNYMLFIPNATQEAEMTEYRCMVYKRNKKLKIEAWSDWRNWKFRCGCRSALKNIFLCEGTQVFRLGESTHDQVTKDYVGDQEMWDDDTPFTDYTGWTPVASAADSGVPIKFIWELPWSDNNNRFLTKNSRYINFDTTGDNRFTVDMFTDNIYLDANNFGEDWEEDELKFDDSLGWDVDVLDPALSMVFEGGDSPGFGNDEFGEDFGGGRPTRLEKLVAWTAKYKLQKLRISGDATKSLKFVSISLAYLTGSPRR
jgi:hypothetical protein